MRILSTICFLALIGFQAQAQDLILGIKGGLNYTSVQTDLSAVTDAEASGKAGYHAGIFAGVKFSKIALVPEVQFSVQNVEVDLPQTIDAANNTVDALRTEFNSTYINVPVMVRFHPINMLFIAAGPQFGFATAQEFKAAGLSVQDQASLESTLKSSDLSLALGAGVNLPFGLMVEARYNLGLSGMLENQAAAQGFQLSSEDDLRNSVFQLSVGYKFL
jgi:hypothetical protein